MRLYVNTVLQDAEHTSCWRRDGQPGSGYWSLPEPPTEQTLLYQIVDEYYPAFAALMAEQGKELPGYVQREFEDFSNAGGWSMAFYGFAASLATPSTRSLSAVSVAVSARAVGRGGWPKCRLAG